MRGACFAFARWPPFLLLADRVLPLLLCLSSVWHALANNSAAACLHSTLASLLVPYHIAVMREFLHQANPLPSACPQMVNPHRCKATQADMAHLQSLVNNSTRDVQIRDLQVVSKCVSPLPLETGQLWRHPRPPLALGWKVSLVVALLIIFSCHGCAGPRRKR